MKFYVYRAFDGHETLYVGKGSGRRINQQRKRFRCEVEIIERCSTDDEAFTAERKWIALLKPSENKNAGGAGGRVAAKPLTNEQRRAAREHKRFLNEYQTVGPRRYVARFLLRKVDERNCERLGVSKVDVNRLREVANGIWC